MKSRNGQHGKARVGRSAHGGRCLRLAGRFACAEQEWVFRHSPIDCARTDHLPLVDQIALGKDEGIMRMRANRILRGLIGLIVASLPCLGSPAPRAQQADSATVANAAKITRLLKETGLSYNSYPKKGQDFVNTWSVEFDRKKIGKVRVIVSVGSDIVVSFAILAKKAAIQKSMKFFDTMTTANHEYDYVKIGLDKDGDLFVRTDTPARVIDANLLKAVIDQVANASDEVFDKLSASIKR
jgi:Putative bacterial sensory transduction regulator